MNQPNSPQTPQGEELNPAEPNQTPLEQVHEQQAIQAKNRQATQNPPDTSPEVVGQTVSSDKIHHPQRQLYDGKE